MINNIMRWFKDKKEALAAAVQAGRARDLALWKAGRRMKKEASNKQAYKPGSIGLSLVSQEIKKDQGQILSRRERKALARENRVPFKAYYNGGGR